MERIKKYYDEFPDREQNRLSRSAYDSIESEITKRFITKHVKNSSVIAEVGCGAGHYSTWLLREGHKVHLIDLSENLLKLAQASIEKNNLQKNVLGISNLDARNLGSVSSDSFDVTLVMGPFYHLLSVEDREVAMKEVYRITKPDGLIFSAVINRICPFLNMMHNSPESLAFELEHDTEEMNRILSTGKYENVEQNPSEFTDAYFAKIDDIPNLYRKYSIDLVETFACEGIASYLYDKAEVIKKSSVAWNRFLEIIFQNSTRPELLGTSEHVVYIGKKRV